MIVTPCVGVWIETSDWFTRTVPVKSHPAWVCGLKHILNTLQMYKKVTPCVGVWIETGKLAPDTLWTLSHPAWVCGLKQ